MGLFSFTYMISQRKTNARLRYTQKVNTKNKEILEMQSLRKDIINTMNQIVVETTNNKINAPKHNAFNIDFKNRNLK
jgi:hypothetical protein